MQDIAIDAHATGSVPADEQGAFDGVIRVGQIGGRVRPDRWTRAWSRTGGANVEPPLLGRVRGQGARRQQADDAVRTTERYTPAMKMSREELARRLEEGARIRTLLRQATREWRAMGDRILEERRRGPHRPDQRSAPLR